MELTRLGDRRPTVRQVYALAAALCERQGEELPRTADAASELIERVRALNGHPAPALDDDRWLDRRVPARGRRRSRWRVARDEGRFAGLIEEPPMR